MAKALAVTNPPNVDDSTERLLDRALRAERALDEVTAQRNRLWMQRNRYEAATKEAEHFRRLAEEIQATRSWRITAPLRRGLVLARDGKAILRRFKRFLAEHLAR